MNIFSLETLSFANFSCIHFSLATPEASNNNNSRNYTLNLTFLFHEILEHNYETSWSICSVEYPRTVLNFATSLAPSVYVLRTKLAVTIKVLFGFALLEGKLNRILVLLSSSFSMFIHLNHFTRYNSADLSKT